MTTVTSTPAPYNPYAASPAPAGGTATAPAPSTPGMGLLNEMGTDFSSISSMVAHAGGGGFASYKLSGKMADSFKTLFGKPPAPPAGAAAVSRGFGGNLMAGMKGIALTSLKGAGLSALVSAGVSAVANGVGAATGKIDSSEAMSNVVKDTIGGAVGGLTAVTAGGLGALIFRGGGVMGTVVSVGLGAVGGVLGGQLAKKMTESF